jgi:DNA-directed RNA polymerase specialized sigma24 family protein
LLRYARRLSVNDDEPRDVLQQAFVHAMRSRSRPSDATRIRIVTNEVIDRRRRRRFLSLSLDDVTAAAPSTDTSEVDLVRQALRSIPTDQAAALVLRLHVGRSRAEIAAHFVISEEA